MLLVPLLSHVIASAATVHALFQVYSTPQEERSLWKALLTIVGSGGRAPALCVTPLGFYVSCFFLLSDLFVSFLWAVGCTSAVYALFQVYSTLREERSLWTLWKALLTVAGSVVLAPFVVIWYFSLTIYAYGLLHFIPFAICHDPLLVSIIIAIGWLVLEWGAHGRLRLWSRARARTSQLARVCAEHNADGQIRPRTKPRRKKGEKALSWESAAMVVQNNNPPLEWNWSIYALALLSLVIAMAIPIVLWFLPWGVVPPPPPTPPKARLGLLRKLRNLFEG